MTMSNHTVGQHRFLLQPFSVVMEESEVRVLDDDDQCDYGRTTMWSWTRLPLDIFCGS